jgi:bacillithiol system protein YtxJ
MPEKNESLRLTPLGTTPEAEEFLRQSGRRWLLKHSNTCPISEAAFQEAQEYLAKHPASAGLVVVQLQRDVSNWLTGKLGYAHQSPQLFLIDGGKVRWAASHWSITAAAMDAAWTKP